ncbi:MAG: hypothetical protein EF807_07005 [Candidatus Methanolliviera hydrocarbonicum]|uniref:Uncharacterized protein n=1 Tax=Candidatus Methanolliviera hydrocarbonicum TaxID=2491085 RepID=A0A520KVR0_9EURY|nr:MAG: hypothetical protein EF807_07005 [Candidatus Methanolliviera hydrocarbonicum]
MKMTEKYDLIIPPGVPQSTIVDVVKKFDVDVAERKVQVNYAIGTEDKVMRNILVFRGDHETLKEVESFIERELTDKIEKSFHFERSL